MLPDQVHNRDMASFPKEVAAPFLAQKALGTDAKAVTFRRESGSALRLGWLDFLFILVAACIPTTVPAPVRFSTTQGVLSSTLDSSAINRPMLS
jgi:hypothetical protein